MGGAVRAVAVEEFAVQVANVHDKPGYLIRRCQQIAVALFLERCSDFGLTPLQYAVLRAAEAQPGLDQISLAGATALDRSTIARLCLVLEQRGLLHRATDPQDRRVRRLSLTREGHALLQRAEPTVQQMQEDFLAPLRPSERTAFLAALRTLAAAHNDASRAPLRPPVGEDAA